MNFPKNLKFNEVLLRDNLNQVFEKFSLKQYQIVVNLLKKIREEPLMKTNLKEGELQLLENIQHETFINLDMYIEALDHLGCFHEDNDQYLKSNKELYKEFYSDLKNREEDI